MKFYEAMVMLHILAATVWLGGMLFLTLVLVPITRRLQQPGLAGMLFSVAGRRFRNISWITIMVLIVTGSATLYHRGVRWETVTSGRLFEGEFGALLLIKLVIVGVLMVLSLVHDFILGPRATKLMERQGNSNPGRPSTENLAKASKLRVWTSMLARISLTLAIALIVLAVMMVRGVP